MTTLIRLFLIPILVSIANIAHSETNLKAGSNGLNRLHLQYQHGRATDSDFYQGLLFYYDDAVESTYSNAVSIGWRTRDQLFGRPATLIWYLGFQHFNERGFQPDSYGISVYPKIHVPWFLPLTGVKVRSGLGVGLSYVSRIPVVEKRDFEPDESAKLTVFIDYTLQLPLSQFTSDTRSGFSRSLTEVYLGYSILHRSTAYGLFAETGGGINYIGLGFELVFR